MMRAQALGENYELFARTARCLRCGMLFLIALHVVLTLEPTPVVSTTALRCAIDEAARIWAAYDVVVVDPRTNPTASIPLGATMITVRAALGVRPRGSTSAPRALGLIDFDRSGAPLPIVALNYVGLMQLMAGLSVLGRKEWQWSQGLRDRLVGRALGRALAHELGHFLLATKQHSRSGLMRADHRIQELVSVYDDRYRLDRARLNAMISATAARRADR